MKIHLSLLTIIFIFFFFFGVYLLNPAYIDNEIKKNQGSFCLFFITVQIFIIAYLLFYKIKYNSFITKNQYTITHSIHCLKNMLDVIFSSIDNKRKMDELLIYATVAKEFLNDNLDESFQINDLLDRIRKVFESKNVSIDILVNTKYVYSICNRILFGIITDILLNALKANYSFDKNGNKIEKKISIKILDTKKYFFIKKVKFEIENNGEIVSFYNRLKIFFNFFPSSEHGYGLNNISFGLEKYHSRLYCSSNSIRTKMFFYISTKQELKNTVKLALSFQDKTSLQLLEKDRHVNKITKENDSKPNIIIIDDSIAIQQNWKNALIDANVYCFSHPFDLYEQLQHGILDLSNVNIILCDYCYDINTYPGFDNILQCYFFEKMALFGYSGKIALCSHFSFEYLKCISEDINKFHNIIPKVFTSWKKLSLLLN